MFRLIETIRIENGVAANVSYHQDRMQRSWSALHGNSRVPDLPELLNKTPMRTQGLFKCRVMYTDQEAVIEFIPYVVKHACTLQLVYDNQISYEFKYENRKRLNDLVDQRHGCDDILIIKNGAVTDSSSANIVFKENDGWVTPTSCLLNGTQRQYLLDKQYITEREISVEEMRTFDGFKLINAMILFDSPENPIENIKS